MCTDDTGGVDVPAWRKLALEAIGPVDATPSRRGPGARPKRTPDAAHPQSSWPKNAVRARGPPRTVATGWSVKAVWAV